MPNVHRLHAEEVITEAIAKRALTAWASRDLAATLACMSDSLIYTVNITGVLAPFGSPLRGKAAVRNQLQLLLDTFEFEFYAVEHLRVEGSIAHARNNIDYRHIATGEHLRTRFRLVLHIENGLIQQLEEFHDAAFVEAFMRLVAPQAQPPSAGDV